MTKARTGGWALPHRAAWGILVVGLVSLLLVGCGGGNPAQVSSSTTSTTIFAPAHTLAVVQAAEDTMRRSCNDFAEAVRERLIAWQAVWEPKYAGSVEGHDSYSVILTNYFDIGIDAYDTYYEDEGRLLDIAYSFRFPGDDPSTVDIAALGFVTARGTWMFDPSDSDQREWLRARVNETREAITTIEDNLRGITQDPEYEDRSTDKALINSWLLEVGLFVEQSLVSLESVFAEQFAAIAAVSD